MSSNSKFFIGLIGGLAIGAVLGLLLAPESGEEKRKKVADAARKAASKVKDGIKTVLCFITSIHQYFVLIRSLCRIIDGGIFRHVYIELKPTSLFVCSKFHY